MSRQWVDTTPVWSKPNPYRRYEAEAGTERLELERRGDGSRDNERWHWDVSTNGMTCELPGGDLPDEDAKRLAPLHLANQLRKLLAEVTR